MKGVLYFCYQAIQPVSIQPIQTMIEVEKEWEHVLLHGVRRARRLFRYYSRLDKQYSK